MLLFLLLSAFICIFNYLIITVTSYSNALGVSSDIKENINVWAVGGKRTDKLLPLSSFSFFSHHISGLSSKSYLSITYEHFRKKLAKVYTKITDIFNP